LRCAALFSEHEAPQLIAQTLNFLRVVSLTESLCEIEEDLFFFLLCFEPLLDKLDEHAIVAEAAPLGNCFDLFGDIAQKCTLPSQTVDSSMTHSPSEFD
jgi:hypothetical protein